MLLRADETKIVELYDATVLRAVAEALKKDGKLPPTHYVKDLTPQRGGYGWYATIAPRSLRTPPAEA